MDKYFWSFSDKKEVWDNSEDSIERCLKVLKGSN